MELSPSWEPNTSLATQQIPSILWNQKVRYHVHKLPSLVLVPSQINPVHILQSCFFKIRFNIILPPTPKSS
jgi:hypothetical protein